LNDSKFFLASAKVAATSSASRYPMVVLFPLDPKQVEKNVQASAAFHGG
jgi:hypothetical protein